MEDFKAIIERVKSATNLKQAVEASKAALPYLAAAAQSFAEQMRDAGADEMSGEQKKAMVIKAAQDNFTPILNRFINIPIILTEEQEAALINRGIEFFVGNTIDKTVKVLKKNGWKIS